MIVGIENLKRFGMYSDCCPECFDYLPQVLLLGFGNVGFIGVHVYGVIID